MAKPRAGYQSLWMQLPTVLVQDIHRRAAREQVSATQVAIDIFLREFERTRADLPPKPKAGRRPKGRAVE